MKEFKVRLHWYQGGTVIRFIYANDIEEAAKKVAEKVEVGFSVVSIKETGHSI